MSVAFCAIGDELRLGETREANGYALAQALRSRNVELGEARIVGDDRAAIATALRQLCDRHRLVVLSGGLGPTEDDFTRDAVAEALGVPLVVDAAALAGVVHRAESRGREAGVLERRQAQFPLGAEVVANRHGTAPGFAVRFGAALVVALPGVPREVRGMLDDALEAWLVRAGVPYGRVHEVSLSVFGIAESALGERLRLLPGADRTYIRSLPHFPWIRLRIRSQDGADAAEAFADAAVADLGWRVYARDDDDLTLAGATLATARARGTTLAVAESCTGGHVGDLLTDVAGASDVFLGGAVTYANRAKVEILGVDAALIEAHGAVSPEVARAMALGARARFGADLAIATSGIAGPGGGSAHKPVGTLCVAIATADGTFSRSLQLSGLDRERFKQLAAHTALALARRVLIGELGEPDERPTP